MPQGHTDLLGSQPNPPAKLLEAINRCSFPFTFTICPGRAEEREIRRDGAQRNRFLWSIYDPRISSNIHGYLGWRHQLHGDRLVLFFYAQFKMQLVLKNNGALMMDKIIGQATRTQQLESCWFIPTIPTARNPGSWAPHGGHCVVANSHILS